MNNFFKKNIKKSKKFLFTNKWTFSALFFLVMRNYFKNNMLFFSNFLLPIIILLFFWSVFQEANKNDSFILKILPGLASTGIFSVGFVSFSSVVVGWKNSVIFKKLKTSPVPIWHLPFALILFYVIIAFFAFLTIVLIAMPLNEKVIEQFKEINKVKNILNITLGIFFTILISCLVGLIIGFLAPNETLAQAIGFAVMLITAFLLGGYGSPDMLIKDKKISLVALSLPHYAPIKMIQLGWFEGQDIITTINDQPFFRETSNGSGTYEIATFSFLKTQHQDIEWIKFAELNFKWQIQVLATSWTIFCIIISFLVLKFKKNK